MMVWQMSRYAGSVFGPLVAGLLVQQASSGVVLVINALADGACALPGLSLPRGGPAA